MRKFFAKKYEKICTIQKKAVPLHPLSSYTVVLAQLVEHRIVVPSVVGSSPTFHPKKSATVMAADFFLAKNVFIQLVVPVFRDADGVYSGRNLCDALRVAGLRAYRICRCRVEAGDRRVR